MDPLSITTSLLALLRACSAASSTISKVRSLRRAPALIQALNNEISDLQLSLMDFTDYLREKGEGNSRISDTNRAISTMCSTLLNRTKSKVEDAEMLIHYQILKPGGESSFEINRIAFLREQNRLNQLQADLRNAKQQITGLFSRLGLRESSRIEVLVRDLSLRGVETEASMQDSLSTLICGQLRMERALDQMIHAPSVPRSDLDIPRVANSKALKSLARESFEVTVTRKQPAPSRKSHTSSPTLTLGFLQSYLGMLFIGYTANPVLDRHKQSCSSDSLSELTLVYMFPVWLLRYALLFRLRCSLRNGLTFSISFSQILALPHIFLDFVEVGDIDGMTALLSSGQITINAEYSNGTGHLHVSRIVLSVSSAKRATKASSHDGEHKVNGIPAQSWS